MRIVPSTPTDFAYIEFDDEDREEIARIAEELARGRTWHATDCPQCGHLMNSVCGRAVETVVIVVRWCRGAVEQGVLL